MQFTVKLEESDEGGYTSQCLELPAAISKGDTKEEALENIKEAIQLVAERKPHVYAKRGFSSYCAIT